MYLLTTARLIRYLGGHLIAISYWYASQGLLEVARIYLEPPNIIIGRRHLISGLHARIPPQSAWLLFYQDLSLVALLLFHWLMCLQLLHRLMLYYLLLLFLDHSWQYIMGLWAAQALAYKHRFTLLYWIVGRLGINGFLPLMLHLEGFLHFQKLQLLWGRGHRGRCELRLHFVLKDLLFRLWLWDGLIPGLGKSFLLPNDILYLG